MKIIVLVVSFLLEGIVSKFLPSYGLFLSLFTLDALIAIYPLFDDKTSYYKYAFITGLAYDWFYTDTIIVHAFLFLLMAFIITKLFNILSDNYMNLVIKTIICIVIYRVISYLMLIMTGGLIFNFASLLESIYRSLILNIIYVIILTIIINFINRKSKFKKRYFI